MAIRFLNIRSGEEAVAEDEPQIAALWASSDRSPNITQGQDFGWRIAPSVIVQMKQIEQDPTQLQQIAVELKKPYEDLKEYDILTWISIKTRQADAPIAQTSDYQDAYDDEIKRLTKAEQEKRAQNAAQHDVATNTTTESLADFEKRVELEERMAKAKAAQQSAGDTTTTTTTVKPVSNPTTTTTTTKVK